MDLARDYEFLICGTDLIESMVSGAMAQARHSVLHIDADDEYGGMMKTKGVVDFLRWVRDNGTVITDHVEELLGRPRNADYAIDIMPRILLSREPMTEVIRRTNAIDAVSLYMVSGLFFMGNDGNVRMVPCSKKALFTDSRISLVQKRVLVKLLSLASVEGGYGHRVDSADVAMAFQAGAGQPFNEVLAGLGLDTEIADAIEFALGFAPQREITAQAISRVRATCESIGRYGPGPLLAVGYGAGDLPQVFCRVSAVFGTPFVLRHSPASFVREGELVSCDIPDIGRVRARHVVISPGIVPSVGKRLIAERAVVISQTRFLPVEEWGVCMVAPGVCGAIEPVQIVQFGFAGHYAPAGVYVIHVTSMGPVDAVAQRVADAVGGGLVLHASFTVHEPVADPSYVIEGVTVVTMPSFRDALVGADWYVSRAMALVKQFDAGASFYPAETEVELID